MVYIDVTTPTPYPDPYMQGHPLMKFRRVRIGSMRGIMRGKLEKSPISLVFTGLSIPALGTNS